MDTNSKKQVEKCVISTSLIKVSWPMILRFPLESNNGNSDEYDKWH